jgi:hypothetical protein
VRISGPPADNTQTASKEEEDKKEETDVADEDN